MKNRMINYLLDEVERLKQENEALTNIKDSLGGLNKEAEKYENESDERFTNSEIASAQVMLAKLGFTSVELRDKKYIELEKKYNSLYEANNKLDEHWRNQRQVIVDYRKTIESLKEDKERLADLANTPVDELRAKCDELTSIIAVLEKEESSKKRSYFEIAATEREFKAGEVVHHFLQHEGWVFNATLLSNGSIEDIYPIIIKSGVFQSTFTRSAKHHETAKLRCLFTTEEVQEMGMEIPNAEE